ncbi:MAG TPA: trypsin-like peptidase domain-containing protein [Bacteroidota bacterium]|jgi:serine protease Do|nr:trypsin-like peptidase domain-containing protein [Bacteroidota bacterium]
MPKKLFILLAIISIPFLAGFLSGYRVGHHATAAVHRVDQSSDDESTPPVFQTASRDSVNEKISGQRHNAITRAVAVASPAVVGINVTEVREYQYQDPFSQFFGNDPFFRQYFGNKTYRQEVKGLGSGFLISADGYILTNDHVAGNAKEITITLTNKGKYTAKLVGTDMVSDISLLKIDGKDLPFIKLGNSDDVLIGEWVIAMGNPFGLFEISDKPTVTVGVVSATGMNLNAEGGRYYRNMIQTDAAINSGNSGGPLLNSLGEVIGVNAVIFTPNQGSIGLGFAIPINRVKGVLSELKKTGKIERNLWTGLEIQTVDRRVARYFGLDQVEGVIVSDVKRASPAQKAGFKVGDIILEVNGEKVNDDDTLIGMVVESSEGTLLKMKILREKKPMNLELRLERGPS